MIYESIEKIRKLAFGLFITLIIAFISIIYFIDVDKYMKKQEDSFSIEDSYIRIIREGKLKWEVWTETITVDIEDEIHRLENIHKGTFYRGDKPPFNFHADRGTYNSTTDEVRLEGNIEFVSENGDYFKSEKVNWYGKPERLNVPVSLVMRLDGNTYTAGEMEAKGEGLKDIVLRRNVVVEIPDVEETGSDETKKDIEESEIDKRYLKNLVLTAQVLEYKEEPKKTIKCYPRLEWRAIYIPGEDTGEQRERVELKGDNFDLKSHELYMDFSEKYAHVVGDVWILRKGEKKPDPKLKKTSKALRKRDTVIETDEAFYYWKEGHIQIPWDLEVFQENMDLTAGKGFIESKKDTIFLSEGVTLHQEEGSWITEEGVIEEDADEEVKEASLEKTDVTCEMMDLNFETEDLNARGDVVVVQEKRKLVGTAATYDSEIKRWVVYGEPLFEEEDQKLTAEMFVYMEGEGEFEALGDVVAEVVIDDAYNDDILEYYRERDGKEPTLLDPERAVVYSDELFYDEERNVMYAGARAKILYRDVVIEADTVRMDYENDIATGTGNVIIIDPYTKITAGSFLANGDDKRIELHEDVHLHDFGHPATEDREKGEPFDLQADYIEYFRKTRKGTAKGNVIVKSEKGDRWITSERLEMDGREKIYDFTGSVRFHQESGDWLVERDIFSEEDDKAKAVAKKTTDISCERAVINDSERTIRFEGEVVVTQPQKKLRADLLEVDTAAKRLSASGNVYLTQSSGGWLFEDGLVEEDTDEEVKDRLMRQIQIKSSALESLYGEKKILFYGGVDIYQGKNRATADKLWHYGESGKTILEGNVSIKDDRGRNMRAERIVYDNENKTTEAFKYVSGESEIEME